MHVATKDDKLGANYDEADFGYPSVKGSAAKVRCFEDEELMQLSSAGSSVTRSATEGVFGETSNTNRGVQNLTRLVKFGRWFGRRMLVRSASEADVAGFK